MNGKFKIDTVYVSREEIVADDDLELVYAKKIMDEWGKDCVVAILSPESKILKERGKQADKFIREVTYYTFHPKGEEDLLTEEENV